MWHELLRNLIWDVQTQSWNKKTVAVRDREGFLGSLHGESELWDWQRKILGLLLDTRNDCVGCIQIFSFGI